MALFYRYQSSPIKTAHLNKVTNRVLIILCFKNSSLLQRKTFGGSARILHRKAQKKQPLVPYLPPLNAKFHRFIEFLNLSPWIPKVSGTTPLSSHKRSTENFFKKKLPFRLLACAMAGNVSKINFKKFHLENRHCGPEFGPMGFYSSNLSKNPPHGFGWGTLMKIFFF